MEYIGVIIHLLTIDRNFLGHPSKELRYSTFVTGKSSSVVLWEWIPVGFPEVG